jgi:hypothetical protein
MRRNRAFLLSVAIIGLPVAAPVAGCDATSASATGQARDAGAILRDQQAPPAVDGGQPDASAQESSAPDAAPWDAGCPVSLPLTSWPGPPWDGGYEFTRTQDFLAFFEQEAQAAKLVVPAHQVDCSPVGVELGECTYDPRLLAHDAADVHYSDALERFVGPDGFDYIWVYVQDRSLLLVADAEGAPASYALILAANRCAVTSADQ